MKNKTLRAMLQAMANNHPYVLGDDFYVSINQETEKSFRIEVYQREPYQRFLTAGLLTYCISYAEAFHLSMAVWSIENNPVVCFMQY